MIEPVAENHYRLHGCLDMQDDPGLLQELLGLSQRSKIDGVNLLLDVSELESADSLLLAALLGLQRQLLQHSCKLRVKGMAEGMLGLARVYGIETLLDEFLETALEAA